MLRKIIENTNKSPTIVNEKSNFVVVTYWWGRGNKNNNTSRPCVDYYESIFTPLINLSLEIFETTKKEEDTFRKATEKIDIIIRNLNPYKKHIKKKAREYMDMVSAYCDIPLDSSDKDAKTLICLENYKKSGKTPIDYEYKKVDQIEKILDDCMKDFLVLNKKTLIRLFKIHDQTRRLKKRFIENKSTYSEKRIVLLKNIIKKNVDDKNKTLSEIKQSLKTQIYEEKGIYDILNYEMRYLSPIYFEDMIEKWEKECIANECNFMAVEYPEFAQPGGYQLAINAKPLFIKKALELCKGRSILYIDGDMFIRKYPSIFDMNDVDFMARGWWIDPRSSYKMEESITYDPYTFETSGGTMFFSQSAQSKLLIDKWIEESSKKYQEGKADDRILSLVFNTYKFLLNMKIIQLPVEYLWLTLQYDDRMMEMVYDYDFVKTRNSIFIEHPECLTTEDTASGAGASNDRTPKFYDFLDDNLVPTSEEMHEYLMFPNKEMTNAFKDYFDYMNGVVYIDDGNDLLYERGYVHKSNPDLNESPLYITSYENKLGNNKYPHDSSYTINQLSDENYKLARSMNINSMKNVIQKDGYIEVSPNIEMTDAKLQRLIIRLLLDDNVVLYNPKESSEHYNYLLSKMNTLYEDMDLVFTPIIKSFYFSDFFKPEIDLTKPILFRPNNKILIDFLSMFLSFEEASEYLYNGAYQIISRTRIGYSIKKKDMMGGSRVQTDNSDPLQSYIESYNKGLKESYNVKKHNTKKKRNHKRHTKKNK